MSIRTMSRRGVVRLSLASLLSIGLGYRTAKSKKRNRYLPRGSAELRSTEEVNLVFFGAAGCGWSTRPELPEAIETLKLILLDRHDPEVRVCVTGVALDWSVSAGLRFLSAFGHFDEIVVGRNWLNSAAQTYIWRDVPGVAATPQVVLVRRALVIPPQDGGIGGEYLVQHERLITRKVGYPEIMAWVETGGPTPTEDAPLPATTEPREADE